MSETEFEKNPHNWATLREAADRIKDLESDLKRLWHFAGCPYDHCERCIADTDFIRGLEKRLGPPTADSVIAQRGDLNRCPKCGEAPTYQTPDGTYWDGNAHYWRLPERSDDGQSPGT